MTIIGNFGLENMVDAKPYFCVICGSENPKTFPDVECIEQHYKKFHFATSTKNEKDSVTLWLKRHLNYQVKLATSMKNHMRTIPDKSKTIYAGCPMCDMIISVFNIKAEDGFPGSQNPHELSVKGLDKDYAGNRRNHINAHLQYYAYECKICEEEPQKNANISSDISQAGHKTATKPPMTHHVKTKHHLSSEKEIEDNIRTLKIHVLEKIVNTDRKALKRSSNASQSEEIKRQRTQVVTPQISSDLVTRGARIPSLQSTANEPMKIFYQPQRISNPLYVVQPQSGKPKSFQFLHQGNRSFPLRVTSSSDKLDNKTICIVSSKRMVDKSGGSSGQSTTSTSKSEPFRRVSTETQLKSEPTWNTISAVDEKKIVQLKTNLSHHSISDDLAKQALKACENNVNIATILINLQGPNPDSWSSQEVIRAFEKSLVKNEVKEEDANKEEILELIEPGMARKSLDDSDSDTLCIDESVKEDKKLTLSNIEEIVKVKNETKKDVITISDSESDDDMADVSLQEALFDSCKPDQQMSKQMKREIKQNSDQVVKKIAKEKELVSSSKVLESKATIEKQENTVKKAKLNLKREVKKDTSEIASDISKIEKAIKDMDSAVAKALIKRVASHFGFENPPNQSVEQGLREHYKTLVTKLKVKNKGETSIEGIKIDERILNLLVSLENVTRFLNLNFV